MKNGMPISGWRLKALLLPLLLTLLSCSTRRSVPLEGPHPIDDPAVKRGQILYMEHCQKCHPQGESGVGLSLNRPMPGFMKRFQVRHGLGVMPSFSSEEISDEELGDIVAYLKAMRNK